MSVLSGNIKIPAKCMLFGEYGALHHGTVCVATLPTWVATCDWALRSDLPNTVVVRSRFYDSGSIVISHVLEKLTTGFVSADRNIQFILSCFYPYIDYLKSQEFGFEIQFECPFPPSLGFGSSSALIVALQSVLSSIFHPETISWQDNKHYLMSSLRQIQSVGSGYDIAAQWESSHSSAPTQQVYRYQNSEIQNLDVKLQGCLLDSTVYSDTREILTQNKMSITDMKMHSKIAEDFIREPNRISYFIDTSRNLGKQHGLWGVGDFLNFCEGLSSQGVRFKTLGSGFGDSVWCLHTKAELDLFVHPLSRNKLSEHILYQFEGN